jgi:hypothetical protein
MNEEKLFWMVYCEEGNAPFKKHRNKEDAYAEAQRISTKTGKTTFVLEVVGGFEIPIPVAVRFSVGSFGLITKKERMGGIYTAPHDPDIRKQEPCLWKWDVDGFWRGSCGIPWWMETGTPEENGMNFCPRCGKRLEQKGGRCE